MPLLVGQVSLSACASAAVALCVCACVFTSWLGGGGQGGDAVCRLLSSLYSNDRPCCFTCCGGRSAVQLSPCSSPSL